MNTYRNNARIVGVFFIIATVASIATAIFVGFLSEPDYLANISTNENQVLGGMFLELIWALSVLGIPVMLFPILRKHNESLALGFYSLRFIEALMTILYTLSLLTLLTLGKSYTNAGAPDTSTYQTIGDLLLAVRDWAFLLGPGLVFSLSALILNYQLFQTRLVPRWLSGWGFVGAAIIFVSYIMQFYGFESLVFLFLPIALQEMVFAVWLIVKGYDQSAMASLPA
ncbi:MAG: DUF4386 domain-containing protein [Anaerolineales bacterium]